MLGMGVMINKLAKDGSLYKAFLDSVGKIITGLSLGDDDALHFEFSDGGKIRLFDDGQLCCETRYMITDDNLANYVGATLLGGEIKSCPDTVGEYGESHEIQFLEISTSNGSFTMASHNEHNGYYGGFYIRSAVDGDEAVENPKVAYG